MKTIQTLNIFIAIIFTQFSSVTYAGGGDNNKILNQISIEAELVCLGCNLQKII